MATTAPFQHTNAVTPGVLMEPKTHIQASPLISGVTSTEPTLPSPTGSDTTTTTTTTVTISPTTTEATTTKATTTADIPTTTLSSTATQTSSIVTTTHTIDSSAAHSTTLPSTSTPISSSSATSSTIIPPTDVSHHGSGGGGLSSGAIVGIAIGSAVALAVVVFALVLILRRHKRRQADFNSDVMFNPVNMSQYRPSGHSGGGGGVIKAHSRPSGDPIPDRSNDRMYHADDVPGAAAVGTGLYDYEADDIPGQRPQQYYSATDHHYDPSYATHLEQDAAYARYPQQYYPHGYQTDHDWHNTAAGYYGAEQEGYDGYYNDSQGHQAGHGYEFDSGEVTGPVSGGLLATQLSPPMRNVSNSAQRHANAANTEYIGPESNNHSAMNTVWEDIRDPFASPTIKVESSDIRGSTTGSKTENESSGGEAFSKRFSQLSTSQDSMTSSPSRSQSSQRNGSKRAPHALISDKRE
ncbi:hypothetical protein BGZ49_007637 [Haplosporangium sp. Z 27]|nr:hypothetical protein BGZ49_007637 [Haplosporangium sp. Z 27]